MTGVLSGLVPATSAAVAAGVGTVPRPEGWIGTAEQWTQGLGIVLVLLNIIVLLAAWRRVKQATSIRSAIGTLFFGLAVLPVVVIFFGYTHGLAGMETVRACGGCHTMTSHVLDLKDLKSESLAAIHYKNRYILADQCYTCHADYGMFGTISAKFDGLRHVMHYVAGTYPQPIKIRHPYPNVRCLGCHGESQKFLQSAGHPPEVRPQLMSGEVSCLDCHGPAHTPQEAKQ